jgi:hypothetical protein
MPEAVETPAPVITVVRGVKRDINRLRCDVASVDNKNFGAAEGANDGKFILCRER